MKHFPGIYFDTRRSLCGFGYPCLGSEWSTFERPILQRVASFFFLGVFNILIGGDWNMTGLLNWLVVWNHGILWLSICWECHHPNWRTPSFFRGVGQPPTNISIIVHNLDPCPYCGDSSLKINALPLYHLFVGLYFCGCSHMDSQHSCSA